MAPQVKNSLDFQGFVTGFGIQNNSLHFILIINTAILNFSFHNFTLQSMLKCVKAT